MKLSKTAIDSLSRQVRLELAMALGFTEVWINKLVDANKDNGPLTTTKAVITISKVTGLAMGELLIEKEESQAA